MAILKTFYQRDKRLWTKCVNEFNKTVVEEYSGTVKLNLDFDNREAEYYITAKIYESNSNLVELYNHLSGRKKKDISVSLAIRVRNDFLRSVAHYKELYEWIYNPPILPGINKHTIGKQLRQEFQDHYGAYSEITYLIAITESKSFNKVNKKPLPEYLSVGEYLLRKRSVEGIA